MSFLPPQGPGAVQARPSGYTARVTAVAGGSVSFVVPGFSDRTVHQTTAYVGTPIVGAECTVLFTDGPPLLLVHS